MMAMAVMMATARKMQQALLMAAALAAADVDTRRQLEESLAMAAAKADDGCSAGAAEDLCRRLDARGLSAS